ncbi:arsenate reductase (glutaredoxin) [Pseudooceanicola algae]|uniref:Arsenate reductase n=1 Tax=Pseudooceanicola algae TaxID=1537215 RepID=A0A418SH26_9RHOB|nr:arsenate reductase (glutaredoxin) [Pseudooceanicola algae]QPM90356.1 putative protein YfgD [Pseudooceanicola algae]
MITIWHNPRCSKSREALKLLQDAGADLTERRYLDNPPDGTDLRVILAMLGVPAIAMMRVREPLFRELGLSRDDSEEVLIDAMSKHPRLIERPIAFQGKRAVIGRPPETVLELI